MLVVADIQRLYGDSWYFDRYYQLISEDDTSLFIDMVDGTKVLDFKDQYVKLLDSDNSSLIQKYSLYQTYVKFGETQQEVITFNVVLEKYRFQWLYRIKRFWFFKILRKVDRGRY